MINQLNTTLLNANIFAGLFLVNLYWLLGGKNSLQYFFPSNHLPKKRNYRPSRWKLVFNVLFFAALTWFFFEQISPFTFWFSHNDVIWGNRIVGILFLLRAFGNFTYIGFSKTIKKSIFAKLDSYVYSPACILIAFCAFFNTF